MTYPNTIFSDLKLLQHWEHLQRILRGEHTPPITTEIDPTNKCNHKCLWCIDKKVRQGNEELDKDILIELLTQLRVLGCERIVLKGGGEPLIHPDITEIIRYIGAYHAFKIGIVSNGSIKDDELVKSIAQWCTFIRLSIDAGSQNTHRVIHGANNYDSIIQNIAKLVSYRKELGTKLQLGINYVTWKYNYNDILLAAELFRAIGVDYIHFKMAIMENETLDNDIIDSIKKQAIMARQKGSRNFEVNTKEIEGYYLYRRNKPLLDTRKSWTHCIAPHIVSIITANGNVYPCCYLKEHDDYVFGNINELNFKNIHQSSRRREIMEDIAAGTCRKYCRGRTSNMRYDFANRVFNYMVLRNTMDEGFM